MEELHQLGHRALVGAVAQLEDSLVLGAAALAALYAPRAHELGHFLGAKHDKPGNCDKQGIMGGNPNQWSSCSQRDIRAHYVAYKHKWCMSAAPSACGGTGR